MVVEGALAVVTGASGGIGRASATALARRGARLLLTGRDEEALHTLAARTAGSVVVADLTSASGVQAVAEAAERAGGADILINNAGVGWYGPIQTMQADDIQRVIDLNFLAPIRLTALMLGGMLTKRCGAICFVGSVAGHVGVAHESVYAATKAGLGNFAESLRAEVAHGGVTVSLISPGAVDTGFFTARGTGYQRTWPRPIHPERVADAIVRAIESGKPDAFVPAWMRIAAVLQSAWPTAYRRLSARAQG